jgi:hypothetical protein
MCRRLTALLVMVMVVLATAAPAFAAQPTCSPGQQGEVGSNCGASQEHRANPSGKGNFGQCARFFETGETTRGQVIRQFNPSPQNVGECDLRSVYGRGGLSFGIAIARCDTPPLEPYTEVQLVFGPDVGVTADAGCR